MGDSAIKLRDVSHITLLGMKKRNLQYQIDTQYDKKFVEGTQNWNPILFMIAKNQLVLL